MLIEELAQEYRTHIMFCVPRWTDCAHCFPSMAERICTACAESCAPYYEMACECRHIATILESYYDEEDGV